MAKAQRRWRHVVRAAPPESMPDIQKSSAPDGRSCRRVTWPVLPARSQRIAEIVARAGMKKALIRPQARDRRFNGES